MKKINANSKLLAHAVIGGAGIGVPPVAPPQGMATVLLYVPATELVGLSPVEIQAGIGLPWSMDGEPFWFPQNATK